MQPLMGIDREFVRAEFFCYWFGIVTIVSLFIHTQFESARWPWYALTGHGMIYANYLLQIWNVIDILASSAPRQHSSGKKRDLIAIIFQVTTLRQSRTSLASLRVNVVNSEILRATSESHSPCKLDQRSVFSLL